MTRRAATADARGVGARGASVRLRPLLAAQIADHCLGRGQTEDDAERRPAGLAREERRTRPDRDALPRQLIENGQVLDRGLAIEIADVPDARGVNGDRVPVMRIVRLAQQRRLGTRAASDFSYGTWRVLSGPLGKARDQ